MANWLVSALPVADAVSFEFDDINVTAQHVMTQTVPLMAACSPFTTSSSKTIVVVKFRRTDVFERTGEREVGYKRFMKVCRRSSASNLKTIMMATFYSRCSEQLTWSWQRDAVPDRDSPSVTSPYSLYGTLKTTREILSIYNWKIVQTKMQNTTHILLTI